MPKPLTLKELEAKAARERRLARRNFNAAQRSVDAMEDIMARGRRSIILDVEPHIVPLQ